MWIWNAETPASVPAGARISAGKSGSVDRSLPNTALALVKRSPVSCMPSPESPANRMTTRSSSWSGCSGAAVPVKRDPREDVVVCPPPYLQENRNLRDGDVGVEEDVLHGVEQLHALLHRPLERLAPDDEPGAAGPLVDHRG